MLEVSNLSTAIQNILQTHLPLALAQGYKATSPEISDLMEESAKKFGETVTEILMDGFATQLAAAIDYYIKSAEVYGNIQVDPAAHKALIDTKAQGQGGGLIPNVFAIK